MRRTLRKRIMYNYSRADWPYIISKLNDVNWKLAIDREEPDTALNGLKCFYLVSLISMYQR